MKKQHIKDKETVDEIRRLRQKRENLIFALQEAEKKGDAVRVADLRPTIEKVETAIKNVKGSIDGHVYEILTGTVGPNQIAKIVSRWTGIPVTRLSQNEKTSLVGLRDKLHNRVVGQDQAVAAVANAVLRLRVGLGATERPNGSFLFLGPTGVGKTELAKALADQLFDDENCLIRFNMSEYIEQNSVSRLIGAPGYFGHMEAGQLTEAVKRKPYSIVLFDEIEKAHKSILNLLLQVLDDGHLTDAQGLTVDFRNTIIIMTSNLVADDMLSGFLGKCTTEEANNQVMQKVKQHFSPELLNRVDEKIVFRHLSGEQLREVAKLQMKDVVSRCADRGIALTVTAAAIDYINAEIDDPANGARPIKRWLEKELVSWLSMMLVADEIVDNTTVDIDACPKGSGLTYRLGKNGVVDAEARVLKFD